MARTLYAMLVMACASEVLGLILGGGAGTRLYPLTKRRAKPAVPIGGKYRLVDIPISNCIHSGINRINLLTQFNSVSLHRHISKAYKFDDFCGGWVQILAAEQTPRHTDWFQGTADAVRKHMPELRSSGAEHILILSGDHLYRMDYRPFFERHLYSDADITLAVKPVNAEDAPRFGIVITDKSGQVERFHEKPNDPELLTQLASHPDPRYPFLASMGVYLFKAHTLYHLLSTDKGSDFGRDILPDCLSTHRMMTFAFEGFWEDIGTIRSYFEASLDLTDPTPNFSFFDRSWPIYSEPGYYPASEIGEGCDLQRVLLGDACKIIRSSIHRSVISTGSTIGPDVTLRDVVMLGADVHKPIDRLAPESIDITTPRVGIGAGCAIERAIIDKGAKIGAGVVIRAIPDRPDFDSEDYAVRDGIVVVVKNGIIPPGTVI